MAPILRPRVQRVGCLCYKRVPAAPKATAAARPMPLVPPTTTAAADHHGDLVLEGQLHCSVNLSAPPG